VGSEGAVLLTAAAELAPHMDDHAIGEATRLEVALEGLEGGRGEGESAAEVRRLVCVRVVHPRRADRDAAEWQASGDHGREAGETGWKRIGARRIGDRAAPVPIVEGQELAAEAGDLCGDLGDVRAARIG